MVRQSSIASSVFVQNKQQKKHQHKTYATAAVAAALANRAATLLSSRLPACHKSRADSAAVRTRRNKIVSTQPKGKTRSFTQRDKKYKIYQRSFTLSPFHRPRHQSQRSCNNIPGNATVCCCAAPTLRNVIYKASGEFR